MKNKKLKQIITNKHWGSLAKGYLKLAEQGFLFLKSQKNIGKKKLFTGQKQIYLLEDGNFIIASIWNIKHGLELIIKALGTNFNKQYWNDHDLLFLFTDLKGKISNLSLKRDLNILELLVIKYSNCEFSSKTEFCDKNNNYFRYPEINGAVLDYSFVHNLKRKDINQFLKDIYNLKRAYDLLEVELQYFKSKWKLHKKEFNKELLLIQTIKNADYR